jgi:translation initiation factor RLI1
MTALHPFPMLPPGLVAVTGGERTGKTSFLRRLSGDLPALTDDEAPPADAQWLDLRLPTQDDETPQQVWEALRARSTQWNADLHQELIEALSLSPHLDKTLFMLSAGSRRKVALAGLLACGATVTCLDQPFAALDAASIRVVCDFLRDMAQHPTRTWVVADYEADAGLPWRQVISLDWPRPARKRSA